ncbi:MAG: dihydroorotase [Candidatus Dasytiphilus stammeri]
MTIKKVNELIIRRPDDWHTHLRDNELLRSVLPFTSSVFARAIIMPNLFPPLKNIESIIFYRNRIISAIPAFHIFQPLMTYYITDDFDLKEITRGFIQRIFIAAKLYFSHTTINSRYGIKNLNNIIPLLEHLQQIEMPLLIHGEISDEKIDIYDRESVFIDKVLEPIRKKFPTLKIVFEHISTKDAVQYILEGNNYIAATITPQHLMFNRNHMFRYGLHPHLYCLPLLKRSIHQQALREAIATGCTRFFIGTDTAPHLSKNKENQCGCAGIFNAPTALAAYTTVFEEMNCLQYLESFCAENGPRYYGLPLNQEQIKLIRKPWRVPDKIQVGSDYLVPFLAGKTLKWLVSDENHSSFNLLE